MPLSFNKATKSITSFKKSHLALIEIACSLCSPAFIKTQFSIFKETWAYFRFSLITVWVLIPFQTSQISQQITASDGGNRSTSVDLTVIITNMHNQPPQWEQEEYWVTIPENTMRDTKIVVSSILTSVVIFVLAKVSMHIKKKNT